MDENLKKHICCGICAIPFKRDAKLYYCICGRVFCELCLKMRKCPFCVFKPQDAKRLYVSYTDDNREADDEVERFLSETYMMGVILLQTHDQLVAELNTCRELTKKLDEQSANMTSAVEMARLRKEQMLTSRDEMAHHLNGLKKLVTEREQELAKLQEQGPGA